jgi:serine/threonine-protein kinase RsbW
METLRLPATKESLENFRLFVLGRLQPLNLVEELVFKVELVLEEALTNVIHYAYPEAVGEMEVEIVLEAGKRFCLCVKDWGVPFNPLERPNPNMCEEVSERQVGGLGIYLIRHLVDELDYHWQEGGGNTLTFCFYLPEAQRLTPSSLPVWKA